MSPTAILFMVSQSPALGKLISSRKSCGEVRDAGHGSAAVSVVFGMKLKAYTRKF
jgi:hypothetical protein